jgi:hypothetical protein
MPVLIKDRYNLLPASAREKLTLKVANYRKASNSITFSEK